MKCIYCGKAEVDGVDRCPVCGKEKDSFLGRLVGFLMNTSSRQRQQSDIDAQTARDGQTGSVAAGAARQDTEQRRQASDAAGINNDQNAGFSPEGSNPSREKRTSGFSQGNRADRDSGFSRQGGADYSHKQDTSGDGYAENSGHFHMRVLEVGKGPGGATGVRGLVEGGEIFLGMEVRASTADGRTFDMTVANVVKDNALQELAVAGEDVILLFKGLEQELRPGDTLYDPDWPAPGSSH